MALTLDVVTAMSPDQGSLAAASKLTRAAKWPLRARSDGLVWGECQGSGANPYRVVFDEADHGYKCTCPSRKFPCKHVLALMWMFVEDPAPFGAAAVPDWVGDWLGRRRKVAGGGNAPAQPDAAGKSLTAARETEPEPAPEDPKAGERRRAAAVKRAAETRQAIAAALDELDQWIADQLRTGLAGLLSDLTGRCRAIAARLVDGKAATLAGWVDEIPARLLALPGEDRPEALVSELGKLVLLARAWRAAPDAPELTRNIAAAETREALLQDAAAPRLRAAWEVLGEQIATRRDGLVSQATWLLNLDGGTPAFALLLDFFPASAGRRGSAFATGEQFEAELVFYPAAQPLRAVIAERASLDGPRPWPVPGDSDGNGDPLKGFVEAQQRAPWTRAAPVLLPPGRFGSLPGGRTWWGSTDGAHTLPLASPPAEALHGMALEATAGIWDGRRLVLLAAQSDWGRLALDG